MLDRARAMRNRIAHRLAAATTLLSVLAFSAATGAVWLRCRITGALLPACCCVDADQATAPTPPTAQAADCCDRVVADVERAPTELTSREPLVAPLPAVALADAVAPSSPLPHAPRFAHEQSRAGPPTTRARLIAKSAFLI